MRIRWHAVYCARQNKPERFDGLAPGGAGLARRRCPGEAGVARSGRRLERDGAQRVVDIGQQVVDVLQPRRQAHQPV